MSEILSTDLDDGVTFEFQSIDTIMDDADYPGVRIMFLAFLDRMRIPMKLDISTDDVITPREIEYEYPLLFEDRSISRLAYSMHMATHINLDPDDLITG